MPWRALRAADAAAPPKLAALRRAESAKLQVPPTVWAPRDHAPPEAPRELGPPPWILRSAALGEDGLASSRAGRFTSRVVRQEADYAAALAAVVGSMATESPRSCVLAQPWIGGEDALGGVAFFDGFYYELTRAAGGNEALTAGLERGAVERGSLRRGDALSTWLERVGRVFAGVLRTAPALDLEFVERPDAPGPKRFVLLQARPALFPLRPNRTLSLANHREILGDPPSPWIASALERAGRRAPRFFAAIEPAVERWEEPYAVLAAGRAWLNVSFFHRLMDAWGLPRAFVTEGVGGGGDDAGGLSADDRRVRWRRLVVHAPRLLRLQARSLWTTLGRGRALRRLDRALAAASDLRGLFEASVVALDVALVTNFAINGVWTGVARARRRLGVSGHARVITDRMRTDYDALRRAPREDRERGLRRWLQRYGHRGPLESDVARPRFRELEATLARELASAPEAPDGATLGPLSRVRGWNPLFWIDRTREAFRDDLMRRFEVLRARLLHEARALVDAGHLDHVEDVFLLTAEDVRLDLRALHRAAGRRRVELEQAQRWRPPGTTTSDALREHRAAQYAEHEAADPWASFRGIALTERSHEGVVQRADDLVELLEGVADGSVQLGPATVLVVPALEPSWAVLFDRVGAVVAELGGELSHASILLREADKPAIVDAPGVCAALADGDRVRLDAATGTITRAGDPAGVAED